MDELRLTLTLNEVNQILDALGERPYAQVHQLIAKLHQQASDQLETEASEPPTEESNE